MKSPIFFPVRMLFFFATILLWVGVFNLTDIYIIKSTLWTEVFGLLIAVTMLFIVMQVSSSHQLYLKWLLSSVTIFFSILAWKCTWNLLDYHVAAPSMQRELIYTFSGLFILILFGRFHDTALGM
jgi:hypothetical protein